jgi:DNA polymerase-3 subunit delta'
MSPMDPASGTHPMIDAATAVVTEEAAATPTGWSRVVGQDDAVALLQRAAERPSHSYLLVGPSGSGVEDAARCFAAAVLAPDDDRAFELALRGVHPDIVEIDPAATQIRVEDAQTILDEAYRSPVEGARKAILVFEAERLNEQAANKLLKTLEEPPDTALIVLVTAGADQLLETIRSRCQRVDFAYLGRDVIRAALHDEGVEDDRLELVTRLAGGRLDRARALAGSLAGVRDAFVQAARSADATGAGTAVHVAGAEAAMQAALAQLELDQAAELERLTAELTASGYPDRVVRTQARRLADRQKRAHRAARTELLVEGITALETVYRDALAGPDAPRLDVEHAPLLLEPRSCTHALDACRDARHALAELVPNETLLLERLFLHLPAVPR